MKHRDMANVILTERFGKDSLIALATVSENSLHPFMEETDVPVVENWLKEHV